MKDKFPVTLATRFLDKANISYEKHLYKYEDNGGTAVSARELGVNEHDVIKTLIMEDDEKHPLVILMHGDMSVSTKELARFLNVKTIAPCTPATAEKHSGYLVGGTSPFGTKKVMNVYVEKSILELDKIYINGGRRGFLVSINPKDLKILNAKAVDIGNE